MKYGGLIIEDTEFEKIKQLIAMSHNKRDETYKASVEKFRTELQSAKKVSYDDMPADVVRLFSAVTIEDAIGKKHTYQIVTPDLSDLSKGKISVLAPMGLALFGYAKEDEVLWQFPAGLQQFRITDVVQTTSNTLAI